MPSVKFHARLLAVLMACAGSSAMGADFAPPAEGPVAFRRDKVPLDVETMSSLSRDLGALAGAAETDTPAERREVAKIIALSLALDPANAVTRGLLDDLVSGTHKPKGDEEKNEAIRDGIRKSIEWLETPDAGIHGKALALCLGDVIGTSAEDGTREERGAWNGWIPALSAYDEDAEEKVRPANDPEPVEKATRGPALGSASMIAPVWKPADPKNPYVWNLSPELLEMTAVKAADADAPFELEIGGPDLAGAFPGISETVLGLLKARHGTLPAGIKVTITNDALVKSRGWKKLPPITAAVALLADAAITGNAPDAIVVTGVSGTGELEISGTFWDELRAMGKGKGERLVLPVSATGFLSSILAMERPEFFLDREVLLASNFNQVLDFSSSTPAEPLAAVMAKFAEIRAKAPAQGVGQYLANTFVRRRLAEIEQEAPYHASARMLGIQAAGNRPIYITRTVLISEILKAIQPADQPARISSETMDLAAIHEACRTGVDLLERYTAKDDRAILSRAQEVVASLRTVERLGRTKGNSYDASMAHSAAYMAFKNLYMPLVRDLEASMGEGSALERK